MASPEIGIRINAQGVAEAQRQLAGLQGTMAGIGTAAQSMRSVLAGLTGVFSVTAVASWVRSHANAIDAMNDLADATGATIEEISKLDQVARRNGGTLDQVGGILVKFNQALRSAEGDNGVSKALQAIGLDAQKLREADPAVALRQTAIALQEFADNGDKARVVQELFGKSIREAAPFLKDLAEAGELTAKVTGEQARQAEVFNKALAQLNTNVGDAGRQFASVLLPTLTEIAKQFTSSADGTSLMTAAAEALLVPIQALAVLGANVAFVLSGMGREIGGIAAQAAALASGDFSRVGAIRRELIADGQAALQRLDDFERRILGIGEKSQRTQRDLLRSLEGAYEPPKKQIEALTAATKSASTAYADLIRDIDRARTAADADADAGGKMSEARRLQIELIERFTRKTDELTAAQRRAVAVAIGQAVVARETADAERAAMAAAEQAARARADARQAEQRAVEEYEQRERDARRAALDSVEARIQAITDEEAAVKLARDQNVSLAEAIEQVAIARLRERQAQYQEGSEPYLAVQREIDARQRLLQLIGSAEARKASEQAAMDAAAAWQRTADQIEQSLTDALMNGGKSGAEYIRGLFRSMVLRPVIQAIVNPIVGAGAGLLGLSGAAQAAGAPGLFGVGAAPGYGLGGILNAGGIAGMGGAFSAGAQLTMTGFSGTSLALQGAGSMIGNGSVMQGLSQGLGAVAPYLAAAYAIYSIAKSMDDSGTPHMGSVVSIDAMGRASTGGFDPSGILRNLNPQTDTALRSLGGGAVNLLNMLGGGGFSAQARFTADGVDPSFGAFALMRNGQTVGGVTGGQPDGARAYGSNREQAFEAFASDVARATRAALDQINLPDWARKQIEALGDGADLDKLTAVAQQIKATTTALDQLSAGLRPLAGALSQLAGFSSDSLMGLADLSGGIDALTGNIGTFYREFFSEAERSAAETARITEALSQFGLALPKTRGEFRDLVDVQIALGDAGRPALAALLGVSGAFASLVPAAEASSAAVSNAADVLRERQGLEQQLLQLTGNTAALRERELAALDPSNRALQQQINALLDQRTAAEAAASALQASAAAAERVRAAQSGLISSLQALQQFGQGLRDAVAGVQSQIAALRQTAAQGVASASDQVRQAVQALGQTAAQAAQAVTAAAAAMEQARQRQAAAALSVQSAIAGQRGTVGSARDALGLLLGQLGGNVAAAQQRVAEIQGRAAISTERLSDVMSRLSDSISGYLAELTGSADAAGPRRLDVVRAQFEQTANLARAGDALAASQLVGAARSLVDASRGGAASGAAFDADVRLVRRVLAEVGTVAGGFGGSGVAGDNGLAQALADLAAAQTIYNQATAQAAALGVTQTQQVDAWSAAVASVTAAQSTLDSMISRAAAAGIDTSLRATADAFDGLIGDYSAAGKALTDATGAWAKAQQDARVATSMYEDAQRRAAAAGVSVAESLGGIEAEQAAFEAALISLSDAQLIAAQVGAAQNDVAADLVTQYRGLEQELQKSQEAVRRFEEDVARVDFSPLLGLSPLGDLLQQYADAVQTLLGAQSAQQRMSATEQWVDIGSGLQRFVSSGGATAISRIGGTAADMTVFGRDGSVFGGQAVKDWVAEQVAKGDLGAIYARATALGVSSNALQLLTGAGDSVLEWAKRNGLPAFATGSSYVQGTGLAVVHEGERILPAADNARLMSVLAGGGDMATEMRALREEVRQFRLESRSGDVAIAENTRSVDKKLDRVIVNDRLQVDTTP